MILSYLKYLWKSTNQHGVHSPFVYDLITKGLYKKNQGELLKINQVRKNLLKNHQKMTIKDFGAGSKIFKNNERTVSQIAKHIALSPKKIEILFKITNYFKPKKILELGTSIGLGTSTLAFANREAKITTVEGCPNIAEEAKTIFNKLALNHIEIKNATFETFIQSNNEFFDLILFDGHHTYAATIKYFEELLKSKHNDSLWIFDDIHWSNDMEKAWHVIKNHPDVSVSIDVFHYGLVFFRREQKKQHFVIRA